MGQWLLQFLEFLPPEYRGSAVSGIIIAIATIITGILGAIIGALIKGWLDRRKLRDLTTEVVERTRKIDGLLEKLRDDDTVLWAAFPGVPPFTNFAARIGEARPPILTVANLKGGVGKTTLVVNLAAYLNKKLGKRVLLIDLDYQGSLTTMLRSVTGQIEKTSKVNELLRADANFGTLFNAVEPLSSVLSRSDLVPAFYELARFEDFLVTEWLLGETNDDVRYRLARVLLDEQIKKRYDVVLIDAPPRLTTGTVNALCASTHLLIPTIFNPLSAETVENFLGVIKRVFINNLNTRLTVVGILETLSPPVGQGQQQRERARGTIEEALRKSFAGVHILNNHVPRRQVLAEEQFAYGKNAEIDGILEKLGDEIREKIGL
jgi:cellulose biosynthesis protein BcsQ